MSRLTWFVLGAVAMFIYQNWDTIVLVQQHQQQLSGLQKVGQGLQDIFGGAK